MKILIEGEKYPISLLRSIFDDPKFYHQIDQYGTILSVGYYHSFKNEEIIYMLPKVFMASSNFTIFNVSTNDLLNIKTNSAFKHKTEYNWIRQISIYFYNSLLEYKRRHKDSSIIQSSLSNNLNSIIGNQEFSYLDLLLSFVNFYKKNKDSILYKHIDYKSDQIRNTSWEKTIRKSIPFINNNNQPIYATYSNRKKIIDSEEELFVYFFSILNHFNKEHNLYLSIDKSYKIIEGSKFKSLQQNGLHKLRQIKYRYFNDTLKKMYYLCELYFSQNDISNQNKLREEFISINNYNIVFEDMVDKLFSDPISDQINQEGISLKSLKYNEDGKIVDHIFDHQSIIDTSNIFYIGDSKYYKSDSSVSVMSKFKQITYAKNVIQYNIDLLNTKPQEKFYKPNIRYRDKLTEGYNITPNFFIFGYIKDYKDFDNEHLTEKDDIIKSFHFEDRLFDRDTLFVHQYKMNFLYILKTYTELTNSKIESFRTNAKTLFRNNFINFFNDSTKSGFKFYEYRLANKEDFIEKNFRQLNGKCFITNENKLLIALHVQDKENYNFIEFLDEYILN